MRRRCGVICEYYGRAASRRLELHGGLIWAPPYAGRHAQRPPLAVIAIVLGFVLIGIAIVYWAEPATLAARLLPGPRGGLQPPPRKARDRGVPARDRLLRVRLVPERPEAHRARSVILLSLISYPRAIILGALQGVTELFPISSLGHAVILPQLFGWNIHQNDPYYITFLVATHFATALVLLGFFWRDWVRIVKGLGRSLRAREIAPDDADAKLGWLLVVGTIPAGILGLLLEHKLRHVFASAQSAAIFLTVNGLILFAAEAAPPARAADRRRRRHPHRAPAHAGRSRRASAPRRRSRSSRASRARA